MKIYFAAAEGFNYDLLKWCGVSRFLASYFYVQKKGIGKYINDDLFLDSGAFSSLSQNKPIDINEYIAFIQNNKCNVYAGLDVIGDGERSEKNMYYMKAQGLNPIPTFHKTSKEEYLLQILGSDVEYIALGGMAGVNKSVSINEIWLDKVWNKILTKRPEIKVHGFGMTTLKLIKKYPWHSIDSSTWNVARKFAEGYDIYGNRVNAHKVLPALKEKHGILFKQFSDSDILVINTVLTTLKIEQDINNSTKDYSYLIAQQGIFG